MRAAACAALLLAAAALCGCYSPGCKAARAGDAAQLTKLLDAGQAKADDGTLYCAVKAGRMSTTRLLVERGAKPRQWTMWKAEKHPELLAYLQPAAKAPEKPAEKAPEAAPAAARCPNGARVFEISKAEDYQKALAARGTEPVCLYLTGAQGVIVIEPNQQGE